MASTNNCPMPTRQKLECVTACALVAPTVPSHPSRSGRHPARAGAAPCAIGPKSRQGAQCFLELFPCLLLSIALARWILGLRDLILQSLVLLHFVLRLRCISLFAVEIC